MLDASPDVADTASILVRENFPIDEKETESGKSLLHVAVELKKTKVVEFLLGGDADPWAKDSAGFTPIGRSVVLKDLDTLKVFDKFDKKLLDVMISSAEEPEDVPLIHLAVEHGATEIVGYLISRNPECVNQICRGDSVVHLLCSKLRSGGHAPLEDEIPENLLKGRPPKKATGDSKNATKTVADDPEAQNKKLIEAMILLVLGHCSKDILITKKSGSVLHSLIQIGFVKGIELIYERFKEDKEFLKTLTNSVVKRKPPPIEAVVRIAYDINDKIVNLYRLFLDNEADLESAFEAAIDVSELRLLQLALERVDEHKRQDWVRLNNI